MTPREFFETRYRSVEVLLRVYRLLESSDEGEPFDNAVLLQKVRDVIASPEDEKLILIMNHIFMGIVREQAELSPAFFRRENLRLLLRQAIVAACSALDVLLPALLDYYLPQMMTVLGTTYVPHDAETRAFFNSFRLKLDDLWIFIEEPERERRLGLGVERILAYCKDQALANERGIAATLSLLTIEKPWPSIAAIAGEKESALRERIRRAVARRNNIIHRADRVEDNVMGPLAPIDYVWTLNHVTAIQTVALACCTLAQNRLLSISGQSHP